MKLDTLRLTNFQCFGPTTQAVTFDPSTTMIIGPNGSGKTAILQALSRMFDSNPNRRRIRREDFHVPREGHTPSTEQELTIEADFLLPEAALDSSGSNAIPPCFNHMRLTDSGDTLKIRFKLHATMGPQGDVEESLYYITGKDPSGKEILKRVPRAERNHIAVYYLPAKREPLDQIRAGTASLLGRIVRAVDWVDEGDRFDAGANDLKTLVSANSAIASINAALTKAWSTLHRGSHFTDAAVVFGLTSIGTLIDNLSVEFNPAHASHAIDYSLLSDGQKSLLYLSLVISFIEIGRKAMSPEPGIVEKIQLDALNPPVFSLIAIEEPENSLSPYYLGRINGSPQSTNGRKRRPSDCDDSLTLHSKTNQSRPDPPYPDWG